MLEDHDHILTPATVSVKSDTSTFCPKVVVTCSEELEAFQQSPHRHVSVKHKMEDEEKSLFFPPVS